MLEKHLACRWAQSWFQDCLDFFTLFLQLAFPERAPWCAFEVIKLILQAVLTSQLQECVGLKFTKVCRRFKHSTELL